MSDKSPFVQTLIHGIETAPVPLPTQSMAAFPIGLRYGKNEMNSRTIGVVVICEWLIYHLLAPVESIAIATMPRSRFSIEAFDQLERIWRATHEALTSQSLIKPYPSAIIYGDRETVNFASPEVAIHVLFERWVRIFRFPRSR